MAEIIYVLCAQSERNLLKLFDVNVPVQKGHGNLLISQSKCTEHALNLGL